MQVRIVTIFPALFKSFLETSLIAKACEKKLLNIEISDIRAFASPPHYKVDDVPYGGGAGMVMTPEPLARAIEASKEKLKDAPVILLSPAGRPFSQSKAQSLAKNAELILVCGRYEGVDQRVIDLLVDEEISIGDYILMGGEIPAMVLVETTARLIPGVLGNDQSTSQESFAETSSQPLLEAPHYTRPEEFRGKKVPAVLLSGNHAEIAKWRAKEAVALTTKRRPDLLKGE